MRVEDYSLIGDTHTAALVGRDGSIDWLCLPRFDSPACFAALLGTPEHGRWQIGPADRSRARVTRRYRPGTLVLETDTVVPGGAVRVVDCMPVRGRAPDVVRMVEGRRGRVAMRMELVVRFDYGSIVPWVRRRDGALQLVAGPDALELRTPVETRSEERTTVAEFEVAAGDRVPFTLTWHPSHLPAPEAVDAAGAVDAPAAWWEAWSSRCVTPAPHRDLVQRSLITLKALTYAPTGGMVAAPTTSLPENLGRARNWDYRYCWLRDATLRLYALMLGGYDAEAAAWREWLLRATAGAPEQLQDQVRPGRRTAPGRAHPRLAPRLRGLRPRAGTRPAASSSSTCTARSWTASTRPDGPGCPTTPRRGTSDVALVNTAHNLALPDGPARSRGRDGR